jgi:alpha-tubulin suppressor-like RCC1 family protein
MQFNFSRPWGLASLSLVLLVACGGGGGGQGSGSDNTGTSSFALKGQVLGLFGAGLMLQDGAGQSLSVPGGSATFAFNAGNPYLAAGTAYAISIKQQPSGQVCAITDGTGTASANMPNIKIDCATVGLTTASLSDDRLQWGVQTPIKLVLKTETGLLASGTWSCQSNDVSALQVASDCSWAKALRLGNYTIGVVSTSGFAANANVRLVPQRQALMASSQADSVFKVISSEASPLFWGAGDAGQLAQPASFSTLKRDDSARPVQGQLFPGTFMTNMASVVSGTAQASSFAINDKGELLSWGGGGQTLGRATSTQQAIGNVANPLTGVGLKNIVQVQVSDSSAAALTDDGRVYSWGLANYAGQGKNTALGLFPDWVMRNAETPLSGVVQISAGHNFTLALTVNGEVYMWGSNSALRLPNADDSVSSQWNWAAKVLNTNTKLPLSDVVSVAAGYGHALALTSQGQVLAWGSNQYAQLGRGELSSANTGLGTNWVKDPLGVDVNLRKIKSISAGKFHSLALNESGQVLSWGGEAMDAPQLGAGAKQKNRRYLPAYVVNLNDSEPLSGILSISATQANSYALNTLGEVLAWGYNTSGALGNATPPSVLTESSVPIKVAKTLGSGNLNMDDLTQFKNLNQRYR